MVQIDIPMPTDCSSCWIRKNMGCKIANESGWLNNRRDDKCPLKEQEAVEPTWSRGKPFCGACGLRIHGGKFCSECGKPILWEGR